MAQLFADAVAESLKRPPVRLGDDAAEVLTGYAWPGNVRELKAVMTDAVSRAPRGEISADMLNHKLSSGEKIRRIEPAVPSRLPTLREATESLIQSALQQAGGNQRVAAQLLGISQPALSKRLKGKKSPRMNANGSESDGDDLDAR